MKRSIAVLLLFSLVIAFSGCSYSNHDYEQDYDKDWIIGKTAEEITERYGTFDSYGPSYSYYTGEILGWQGIYYLSDDIRAFDGEKLYGKDFAKSNIDNNTPTNIVEKMVCQGADCVVGFEEITWVSDCNKFAEDFIIAVSNGQSVNDAISSIDYDNNYRKNMYSISAIGGNGNIILN